MAFDDRKTDPLIAVGCLSVLCGLGVPIINRLSDGWWGLLLFIPPVVVWLFIDLVWGRARHRGPSRQTDPAPAPARDAGS